MLRFLLVIICCFSIKESGLAQLFATWNDDVLVIRKFYDLLYQDSIPTVEDFLNIFGTVYNYEEIMVKQYYLSKGLSEEQSNKKSQEVLDRPELYESLVYKTFRMNKDLFGPVNVKSPMQHIFISLDTINQKLTYNVRIQVLIQQKNGEFNKLAFSLCNYKRCGPFGPTIEEIYINNETPFIRSLGENE